MKRGDLTAIECSEKLLALRDDLDVFGCKFKMLIFIYLHLNSKEVNHFKKMQREIPGISAKMLSKELKDLHTNLLIEKKIETEPILSIYTLTPYGETAVKVAMDLTRWGVKHRAKIKIQ